MCMCDELEAEHNARWDDNAERWASEREDARRVTLADLAEDDEIQGPYCAPVDA